MEQILAEIARVLLDIILSEAVQEPQERVWGAALGISGPMFPRLRDIPGALLRRLGCLLKRLWCRS